MEYGVHRDAGDLPGEAEGAVMRRKMYGGAVAYGAAVCVLCLSLFVCMGAWHRASAQFGWEDIGVAEPGYDEGPQTQAYDDKQFDYVLRREQRYFTDPGFHRERPLRRAYWRRGYPSWIEIYDSWFDVYWDTPAFRSRTNSDGTALITFMFRDAVSFPEPLARYRSLFDVQRFIDVALARWTTGRNITYPVYGYWALMDFSKHNEKLVKKYLAGVAGFSFMQHFHARRLNGPSTVDTVRRILMFLTRYRLPVLALLPSRDETVLIYRAVRRADGVVAFFYYRPADDAFYRRANEYYWRNVIFAIPFRDRYGRFVGVKFCDNARFSGGRFVWGSTRDDILIIDDLASVYREVAGMLRLSGIVAGFDLSSGADPTSSMVFFGNMMWNLTDPNLSGDERMASMMMNIFGAYGGTGGYGPFRRTWGGYSYGGYPYGYGGGYGYGGALQWPSGYPAPGGCRYGDFAKWGYDREQWRRHRYDPWYTPGSIAPDVLKGAGVYDDFGGRGGWSFDLGSYGYGGGYGWGGYPPHAPPPGRYYPSW